MTDDWKYPITPQVRALAEASGAYARAQPVSMPLYLPPRLYDALKAAGTDMTNIARVEPLP